MKAERYRRLKGRDGLFASAVLVSRHIAAYRIGAPWLDALRASLAANMRYIEQALNGAFRR